MSILVILLLSSGFVTLCSHIHREYFLIYEAKSWDEAQGYCRENYTDLATIGSYDDLKRLTTMSAASGVTTGIWIGHKKLLWLWSVEDTRMSHRLPKYANWTSSIRSYKVNHCGGIRADGGWQSVSCDTLLPFVCQEEQSGGMHLVHQNKTWREAREYCRQDNRSLAILRSQTENQAAQQLVNAGGSFVSLSWIGLFTDYWKWSNNSDSSFRHWEVTEPKHYKGCVVYNPSSRQWAVKKCTINHPFYCYTEKTTKKIVRVEMKSNSLLNFSDVAVTDAILSQLQKVNHQGLWLEWRVTPDGKIFQKKKKGN